MDSWPVCLNMMLSVGSSYLPNSDPLRSSSEDDELAIDSARYRLRQYSHNIAIVEPMK